VQALWAVTPCSVAVGYRLFGEPCCLNLHFNVKMEAVSSPNTLVSYRNTTWGHRPQHLDLYLHRRENLKSRMAVLQLFLCTTDLAHSQPLHGTTLVMVS